MEETNQTPATPSSSIPAVTLSFVWGVLRRFWAFVLAAAILFGAGAAFYLYKTHYDLYTVNGSFWVYRVTSSSGKKQTENSDAAIANDIMSDVPKVLRSNDVFDAVREKTGSTRSDGELSKMLKVQVVTELTTGHTLEFSVTSSSREEAYALTVAFVECVCDKINNDYFPGEEFLIQPANKAIRMPTAPSNPIKTVYIPVAALVGALAVFFIFILVQLLDERIRTERDVKDQLAMTLLGNIPNRDDAKRGQKKYGKYYVYTSEPEQKEGENQ